MKVVWIISGLLFMLPHFGQAQDSGESGHERAPSELRAEMARLAQEFEAVKKSVAALQKGSVNLSHANCTETPWRARVELDTRYACGENQFIREIRFAHQFQMNFTFQESVQIVCCSLGGGIVPNP